MVRKAGSNFCTPIPNGKSIKFLGNYFILNRVSECINIVVGCVARGEAAFTNLTHPQLRPKASAIELARIAEPSQQKRNLFRKSALAGASVGTRNVIWLWITVGVNLYIIAFFINGSATSIRVRTLYSLTIRIPCRSDKSGQKRLLPSNSVSSEESLHAPELPTHREARSNGPAMRFPTAAHPNKKSRAVQLNNSVKTVGCWRLKQSPPFQRGI